MEGLVRIWAKASASFGLVTLALGLAVSPAAANPIRSGLRHETSTHSESFRATSWPRFLAGGPALWAEARPPRFPTRTVLPTDRAGQLIETPFVNYLYWRRGLNPSRFDHYHPFVGPALGRLIPPPTSTPNVPVPIAGPSANVGPPLVNPAPEIGTPEPGALPVALTLIGAGLWWRRRATRYL